MRAFLACVSALLATAGTAAEPGNGPAASCASTADAVAAAPLALIAADNRRDLEAVLAGYAADAVWLPPGLEPLRGPAAFQPRYESLFRDNELRLQAEVSEAKADGAIGYAWGRIRGERVPVDGSAPELIDDVFLAITRCEAGTWRVSHLMWSHAAKP
jgi:ketosteroid isomerase-like protein